VVALCAAAAAVAAPILTGGFVIDAPGTCQPGPGAPAVTDYELLVNPGFETGALEPWVGSAWQVTDKFPHSGTYCAYDIGNASVVQWTDTVPGSAVQSVTFWSRQPDQPAAQAYSFFYSDGTRDQYVHFPGADWTLMDVTSRLNQSKSLVGFEVWGYSGGGPGPDSTYVDDVSIALAGAAHSVEPVEALCPGDTVEPGEPVVPAVRVRNSGLFAESFRVAMVIEDICADNPLYWDTIPMSLAAGVEGVAEFDTWIPTLPALHRANARVLLEGNAGQDTLRWFFHVARGTGVEEARPVARRAPPTLVRTAAAGVELRDATGRMVSPRAALQPGVYFERAERTGPVRKVLIVR
jgi:hypothetical protein